MNDITFVVFTYNEEARIEQVIKNFIGFGKVLLADDGSTDRTHDIARFYGCDIWLRRDSDGNKMVGPTETQEMVDLIYQNVTTNWIYWGYADEMMDKKTLDKLQSIIIEDEHDIINIDRKNYFYGKFCYNLYHVRTNKIFKKNSISFKDNPIHAFGKINVSSKKIFLLDDKYFVRHFMSFTTSAWINTNNKYTDFEKPFRRKLSPIILLTYLLIKHFFAHYIKEKGYKAGFTGIVMMEMMIFYNLMRSYKLYEKENELDKNSIEKMNDSFRNDLLLNL